MPAQRQITGFLATTVGVTLLCACEATPPRAPPPMFPAPPAPTVVRAPDWSRPATADPPHSLEVRVKPVRDGDDVARLEVTLRFSEPPGDFGETRPLALLMPEREDGEGGFPEAVEEVSARDADGPLALAQQPAKDAVAWRSNRRPLGAVSVTYRVRVARGEPGKTVGTRAEAGGFQGTGATFLMLPETPDTYHLRVIWDLAALGPAAKAMSSFGAGAEVEAEASMDRLGGAVFMAGPLGRISIDDGAARFEGAWLGRPGFDPVEAMAWAARARASERAFFHDADTAPFGFFLRSVPRMGPTWVGSGKTAGFLLVVGEELAFTRTARFVIAHELAHRWIGSAEGGIRFDGPEGSAYWFTEGFTVHYAREILLRAGLCTPDEFLDDLRERAERHATSPARDVPNDVVTAKFWESHDVEKVPYDRGMLYAADVDAAVRAKSGGKRSLDDLVLALLEKARALGRDGGTARLPAGAWRELVGAELGPEAQARFDAVIVRGEPFTPPSRAYGPCFEAVKKQVPRFELGFDPKSFSTRKIQGLVRGSAAERAGLREGDEVGPMRAMLGVTDSPVVIGVKRDGGVKQVSYLPRGKTVEATVWVRDHHAPPSLCAR